MKEIVYKIFGIIFFPIYFSYKNNKLLQEDMERYNSNYSNYTKLIYLLFKHKPFRTIYFFRVRKIYKYLFYYIFKPLSTIEISGIIDGGLYIPHSFCVISVYKAGKNLSILPGVVIGKNGKGKIENTNPIIGDNVLIGANSTLIGPIKIGNNVVIGAGSLVNKDIECNVSVGGNPAKILKYN